MILEAGKEYRTESGLRVVIETLMDIEYSRVKARVFEGAKPLTVYYTQNGRANTVSEGYDIISEWGEQRAPVGYPRPYILKCFATVLHTNNLSVVRIAKMMNQMGRCLEGLGVQDEDSNIPS